MPASAHDVYRNSRRSPQRVLTAAVVAAVAAALPAQVQFTPLPRPAFPGTNLDRIVVSGDVDGDGDLDLVTAFTFLGWGRTYLYRNDGYGNYVDVTLTQLPVVPLPAPGPGALVLGDVDGDGDLDLVLADAPGPLQLFTNNGSGTFVDATATHLPANLQATGAVGLVDVDGDGDLDVVCQNAGQVRLYRNGGAGFFVDATAGHLPSTIANVRTMATGDVDGDGDADLLLDNGSVQALLVNDGTGVFTDVTNTQMPTGRPFVTGAVLGDVDGDGDLDLFLARNGNSWMRPSGSPWTPNKYYASFTESQLYLNNGNGIFVDVTLTHMPYDSYWTMGAALGDVDGDGDLDIVLANGYVRQSFGTSDRQARLWLNDGHAYFTDATVPRMSVDPQGASTVALGDFDGDGDLDVVLGGDASTAIVPTRLWFNVQQQFAAPLPFAVGQTYQLDAYLRGGGGSGDFAWPLLSFAPATIPLAPYGVLGIDPTTLVQLPTIAIPQPAGMGSLSLPIPNMPGLIGLHIYNQAVLFPFGAVPKLSNVVPDVLH